MAIGEAIGGIAGGIAGLTGGRGDAVDIEDLIDRGAVFGGGRGGGFRTVRRGQRVELQQRRRRRQKRRRQTRRLRRQAQRVTGQSRAAFGQLRDIAVPAITTNLARSGQQQQFLLGLREELTDKFGGLKAAALREFDVERERTLGNLRETFNQRRIGGASFAEREAGAQGQSFALQRAKLVEELALRETQLNRVITQDVAKLFELDNQTIQNLFGLSQAEAVNFQARLASIQTKANLDQQQLSNDLAQLGIAQDQANLTTELALRLAFAQAGLEAQAAADRGSAIGGIIGGISNLAFGTSSVFGGGQGLFGSGGTFGGGIFNSAPTTT